VMPVKCAQCGALIDPLALACPYCRFTTPAGVAARQRAEAEAQQRAQWEAHAHYQQQASTNRQVQSSSTHALIWSIAGTVLCCLPLGVVGIVFGARARSLAKRLGTPPPARATIGLALGILSCVLSVAFGVYAVVQSQIDKEKTEQRIAALEKSLGTAPSAPALERSTACGLAEVYALRTGWDGRQGYSLEGFECTGKVRRQGDRAELDDFRFRIGTDASKRFDLRVCFKRGAAWYVSEMRDGPCPME